MIQASGAGDFPVIVDHIVDPTVDVGSSVDAGEILGTAGIWSELQGRTEIQVYNNSNDYSICPYTLLDETVKSDYETRLLGSNSLRRRSEPMNSTTPLRPTSRISNIWSES